jgi:hypothetical protein
MPLDCSCRAIFLPKPLVSLSILSRQSRRLRLHPLNQQYSITLRAGGLIVRVTMFIDDQVLALMWVGLICIVLISHFAL